MKPSRKLLCAAIASVVAGNAHAFVVDGINTGGSEYSLTQDWVFTSSHGDTSGDSITGSMSYGMTSTEIFVLLSVPVDYTNNAYGEPDSALFGWSKYDKKTSSTVPVTHKFTELLNSDKLVATLISDNNASPTMFEIDYLNDSDVAELTKDDATPDLIQSVASSLQYNLSLGSTCGDKTNSNLAGSGCEAQVMYEFSLNESDFTDFGFGNVVAGEIHASPNMVPGDPPNGVPEPSTFALFFAGLPGVLWATRRRKRTRKQ
jgi:hypothetical protein